MTNIRTYRSEGKWIRRVHLQNLHEKVKEKILFSHQETFFFKTEILYKETLK